MSRYVYDRFFKAKEERIKRNNNKRKRTGGDGDDGNNGGDGNKRRNKDNKAYTYTSAQRDADINAINTIFNYIRRLGG